MKKLLILATSIYVLNLTGCAIFKVSDQDKMYQNNPEEARYNKMLGKTANCQQHSAPTIIDKNGHQTPNFTYATPTGQPCLP